MTIIDYFLTSEEYYQCLVLSSDQIQELFMDDPSRAEMFDKVFEAEFYNQKTEGSEMHRVFMNYMESHQYMPFDELYTSVGLYMDELYRAYLDEKYPGMVEAYMSYGIERDIGMFEALGEYIGCALFSDMIASFCSIMK